MCRYYLSKATNLASSCLYFQKYIPYNNQLYEKRSDISRTKSFSFAEITELAWCYYQRNSSLNNKQDNAGGESFKLILDASSMFCYRL